MRYIGLLHVKVSEIYWTLNAMFALGIIRVEARQKRCPKSIIYVLTCSFRIIYKFRFALFTMMIIKIIPPARGNIVNKIIISCILGFPLAWTLSDPAGRLCHGGRIPGTVLGWKFSWSWNGIERVSFALSRCLRCLKMCQWVYCQTMTHFYDSLIRLICYGYLQWGLRNEWYYPMYQLRWDFLLPKF